MISTKSISQNSNNCNIFDEIKKNVSYIDLCRLMNWPYKERNGRIWIHSPFNPHDRNPSCCLYVGGGWKDFSTGEAGGDIISLYAKVRHISQYQAAKELAREFNIPIGGANYKPGYKKQEENSFNMHTFIKGLEAWRNRTFDSLCNSYHLLQRLKREFSIEDLENEQAALSFWAITELTAEMEVWLDMLMSDDMEVLLNVAITLRKREVA